MIYLWNGTCTKKENPELTKMKFLTDLCHLMNGLNNLKRNTKMTPKEKAKAKEKAKRLVETYSIWCWNEGVCDYHLAKILALIAVKEMLNEYPNQDPKDSYEMERHLYWQEVKVKIQKL